MKLREKGKTGPTRRKKRALLTTKIYRAIRSLLIYGA